MAQNARVTVFIINGDMQAINDLAHGIDDDIVAFLLNPAIPRINNIMRTFGKTADDSLSLLPTNGKLHLVAIKPWLLCTQNRKDFDMRKSSDPLERINDLLTLPSQLPLVGKMLQLAAAA